jgi:hypothetical protein
MLVSRSNFPGGSQMKYVLLAVTALLVPAQVYASAPAQVPEPVSLALVAAGFAGLGAAEFIRRRKNK